MSQIRIGKALVNNISFEESVLTIQKLISNNEKCFIVTPNVDHIVKLNKDEEFLLCYNNAKLVLPDGMPLIWSSKLLGTPLKERVCGSDLFPELCKLSNRNGYKLFFLGGLDGVADKAAERLKNIWDRINIVGVYSPPFGFENNDPENDKILKLINDSKPHILFVGVGAPKQEKWINKNLHKLNVNVAIGVGASFDFVAGTKKRAPMILRNIGFEWCWRLSQEPIRLYKRYLFDSIKFVPIIVKQKFKNERF